MKIEHAFEDFGSNIFWYWDYYLKKLVIVLKKDGFGVAVGTVNEVGDDS